MFLIPVTALYLLSVHGPDGNLIDVNPAEISSIREPRRAGNQHFAPGTRCLVYMTHGHFIATTETCVDIVHQISALDKMRKE